MTYQGLVFFDLDGTLYNEHATVDQPVIEALNKIRQNGFLPIICSGRSPHELTTTLAQTKIDSYITLNGSYIVFEGREIYAGEIAKETIDELMKIAEQLNEPLAFYNHQAIALSGTSQAAIDAYKYVHSPLPKIQTDFYLKQPVYMLLALTTDNDRVYQEALADSLTFYRNTPYSIDIVEKNGSKKTGIQHFIKNANLTGIPTYAFGDGNNDIPMLEYVDHPTAMGNGVPEILALGEYITAKNTEGGIIQGLKHWGML